MFRVVERIQYVIASLYDLSEKKNEVRWLTMVSGWINGLEWSLFWCFENCNEWHIIACFCYRRSVGVRTFRGWLSLSIWKGWSSRRRQTEIPMNYFSIWSWEDGWLVFCVSVHAEDLGWCDIPRWDEVLRSSGLKKLREKLRGCLVSWIGTDSHGYSGEWFDPRSSFSCGRLK